MPPVAGQFALVIEQVLGVPVQPVTAVEPAASEEIFAPLIGFAPAASEAIVIVAPLIADGAAFASPLVKVPECAAARKFAVTSCEAPPVARLREPAETSVPLLVPAGITSGCASTKVKRYCSAKLREGRPVRVAVTTT